MLYGFFIGIWIIIFAYVSARVRANQLVTWEPEFSHPFSRTLYRMSFIAPFKWFVDDDRRLTKKGFEVKDQLEKSGYNKFFTVRSYMAFKSMLMLFSLAMSALTIFLLNNSSAIGNVMMNVQAQAVEKNLTPKQMIIVVMFYLLIAMFPNLFLKSKSKKAVLLHSKDLPMIHMFTILMLRSNKTVSEILYALSKLNTFHKETFERGYRMYVRNKHEGMAFMRSHFENERFIEMFNLLEDIAEYAREECIQIMESNMKNLVDDINGIKRRNDLSHLVYSQASMVVPFTAVILLGAAPIVIAGLSIFNNSLTL